MLRPAQACRQRRIDKNPGKAVFVAGARRPVVESQVLSYGQGRELASWGILEGPFYGGVQLWPLINTFSCWSR